MPEATIVQDSYGHLPLHKAVSNSGNINRRVDPEIVKLLLEINFEAVTHRDKKGYVQHTCNIRIDIHFLWIIQHF